MKIDKLMPMTEFVFQQAGWHDSLIRIEPLEFQQRVLNYANFLCQNLTLEMFIGEEAFFEGWELIGEGVEWSSKVAEIESVVENAWIDFIDDKAYITYSGFEEYEIESIEQVIIFFNLDLTLTQKAKQIIYGNNN